MDVCIDTIVLEGEMSSIDCSIESLRVCINFLKRSISDAHSDFDSINFYRISKSIDDISKALNNFEEKLVSLKMYLSQLVSIIDKYNKCVY